MSQLTALLPIADGRRLDVDTNCAALYDVAGTSVFDRLSRIHMARFEVIDTLPSGGRRMKTRVLDQPILLFGAAFDGTTADLLDDLATQLGEQMSTVFRCCENFPGVAVPAFTSWILEHSYRPQLQFAARTETRQEIERAMSRQERLRSFLLRNERLDPHRRRREFMEEFG